MGSQLTVDGNGFMIHRKLVQQRFQADVIVHEYVPLYNYRENEDTAILAGKETPGPPELRYCKSISFISCINQNFWLQ